MAEIKIEKKKPIWPWILALLLIAAIVYYVFLKDNTDQIQRGDVEIENVSADSTSTTTN